MSSSVKYIHVRALEVRGGWPSRLYGGPQDYTVIYWDWGYLSILVSHSHPHLHQHPNPQSHPQSHPQSQLLDN